MTELSLSEQIAAKNLEIKQKQLARVRAQNASEAAMRALQQAQGELRELQALKEIEDMPA